ncbi:MAG: nitrate ABC transporter ATP-binding protein [Acidobacteria bacterium]|nr:MAG: nitrate ABC transporter ATP-binding protein [Acidobacteriota bacterium]
MLELSDVTKRYNGQTILDRISMKIATNEVTGLLGPSGSGKSTILKMFAGMVQPDSGTVRIGSQRIGFVFQEHRLIPWKTAGENVCFALQSSGMEKKEARERAAKILQQVELASCINQYPNQLSGGMCQRVSIARALAIQPAILLLDEPLSSLDMDLKNNLLDFLQQILKKHRDMTVLYVTHDPSELTRLAHFVYQIEASGQLKKTILQTLEKYRPDC